MIPDAAYDEIAAALEAEAERQQAEGGGSDAAAADVGQRQIFEAHRRLSRGDRL
jgi:hypothetical protein